MHNIDLNLLRVFDAVYRAGSVSRAAEELGLTQPSVSQAIGRLRRLLKDPLFRPSGSGMRPTAAAERLAGPVRSGLATLGNALGEQEQFDPALTRRTFKAHMSDIGEGRFLPLLVQRLTQQAPGARLETRYLPPGEIGPALDAGSVDFAFGFLPQLTSVRSTALLTDRYVVVVRRPPGAGRRSRASATSVADLRALQFVAVRSHADTFRILRLFGLEDRLKLTIDHFTAIAGILRSSDLAAIMPRSIGQDISQGDLRVLDVFQSVPHFTVGLHWSERYAADPGNEWFRNFVVEAMSASQQRPR